VHQGQTTSDTISIFIFSFILFCFKDNLDPIDFF
jgi:hypothetical protein